MSLKLKSLGLVPGLLLKLITDKEKHFRFVLAFDCFYTWSQKLQKVHYFEEKLTLVPTY